MFHPYQDFLFLIGLSCSKNFLELSKRCPYAPKIFWVGLLTCDYEQEIDTEPDKSEQVDKIIFFGQHCLRIIIYAEIKKG